MKDARRVGRMVMAIRKVAIFGMVEWMTRRGRLVALLCLAIALSDPSRADPPSCSCSGVTPGVYPAFIKVVQLDNAGQADLSGRICLTIRDGICNLEPGARLELDFSDCCDINICDFVPSPNPYFQELRSCIPPRIRARSDPSGEVCITVVGAAKNPGTTDHPAIFPGAGLDCIKIRLLDVGDEGQLCDSATAVAFDQNGATNLVETPAVNAGDVGILLNDIARINLDGNPYMGRDDYFFIGPQAGQINAADVGELLTQVFRASPAGGEVGSVNACPGQAYCKTKVQTENCTRQ